MNLLLRTRYVHKIISCLVTRLINYWYILDISLINNILNAKEINVFSCILCQGVLKNDTLGMYTTISAGVVWEIKKQVLISYNEIRDLQLYWIKR